MMGATSGLLPLIPLLPLAGFLILTFFGHRLPGRGPGWLAAALVGVAFLAAVGVGLGLPPTEGAGPAREQAHGAAASAGQEDEPGAAKPASEQAVGAKGHRPPLSGVTQVLWTWIDVGQDRVEATVALTALPVAQRIPAGAVGKVWLPLEPASDLPRQLAEGRLWDPVAVVGQRPMREVAAGGILTIGNVPPPPGGFVAAQPARQSRFVVEWAYHLDSLSWLMILLVTGVGFLIHVFSIGYMGADADQRRFFAYLSLFVASMLVLVLGGNFLVLFVGWELVGLCSYLLIGFWYREPANASAGRKAFLVNRVGDLAFLVGLMLLWSVFGSLSFDAVFAQAAAMPSGTPVIAAICLLLLVGATGKSAQIPLYVWLPDAMAGPTPVSALIHAATMVTAGVYMVARAHALYDLAPQVLALVAVVGVTTALVAAVIAVAQVDIKKVLAYSTISQLGFMFLALGAGAYVAAIFHLVTHAFFKGLLFLGAGSVMHGMEHGFAAAAEHPPGEDGVPAHQDMRQMGGLLGRMPYTGWTFAIGGLALAGLFPLAGFWSKDEILHDVLAHGSGLADLWTALFLAAALAAFLTAFYTGRQLLLVLAGRPRSAGAEGAHESPPVMTVPLVVLAILTVVAGAMGLKGMDGQTPLAVFLAGSLASAHGAAWFPSFTVPLLATAITLAGLGLAWLAYGSRPRLQPDRVAGAAPWIYRLVWNKLYIDELYGLLFVRPFKALAGFFWRVVDDGLVDGAVNGVGRATVGCGAYVRRWQTGYTRSYALTMLLGAVLVVLFLVFRAL